ncbi:NAD-dependent glutamate dehydrogenase [Coemansia thaxteri]|uniref:NAD-dependent glutamate dehydrogenase n=1 Tax=Coemansia thaxteri TaxID=2663907 RepID=A0A9W8ED94_9FUNG|nr:NAD-dependent glutamate dehydrogenase [Coemansia thaxteri]KAJ2462447.1 NAD-dependent glutamate dehydrogenase [Coemansia sp. RSA 2320]
MTIADPAGVATHSDYTDNVYSGKQEHRAQVCAILEKDDHVPKHVIESEVKWFYDVLGLDDMYFMLEDPATVACHITSLYGAQLSSMNRANSVDITFESRREQGAVFIHNSVPGISKTEGPNYEKM